MNSKDIKPWRKRGPSWEPEDFFEQSPRIAAQAMQDEISELRQALVAAEAVIRGIAQAKRFDRQIFSDADAFVDWAQSLCRHHLEKP